MNTYDKAHELAKALKNSEEYKKFLVAKQAVDVDEAAKKMVRDFMDKRMEIEYEMMAGKPEDAAKTQALQKMYEVIAYNNKAREFLEAYMRFQQVMGDIYKIIGDSVSEGMNIFGKDKE